MRTRVAVIGGGQNGEHDVSLASAAAVAAALDPAAYDAVPLTIGRDGTWRDRGLRPIGLSGAAQVLRSCDVVFPVVHGPRGEDGALAALCELAGLPYVGSGVRPALEAALALDDRALVEDAVAGREIDVAVLGRADGTRVAAPALEIVGDGIFDFDAKYGGRADFRVPARLGEVEAKALEDAALAAYDALGCAGVARVDFFLTADGPVLNEVNTAPGMTEHSQVPRMFAAAGLSYPDLLGELVRGAHR